MTVNRRSENDTALGVVEPEINQNLIIMPNYMTKTREWLTSLFKTVDPNNPESVREYTELVVKEIYKSYQNGRDAAKNGADTPRT